MRAKHFDPEDVVAFLEGSCLHDIHDAFGKDGICNNDFTPKYPDMTEDDLTEEDYNYIANFIFRCDACGWWCDTGDANYSSDWGGDICTDCYESEQEEEDDD